VSNLSLGILSVLAVSGFVSRVQIGGHRFLVKDTVNHTHLRTRSGNALDVGKLNRGFELFDSTPTVTFEELDD
jgi:hypothetical protein